MNELADPITRDGVVVVLMAVVIFSFIGIGIVLAIEWWSKKWKD